MNSAPHTPPLPVFIIAGPTASGKSAVALDMAENLNGVVINADSLQVYSHLHILTARPGERDQQRAPHKLYGIVEPSMNCSVAQWRDMAASEVRAARENGQVPIVVGGTGMYIRALMHGLAPIPAISDSIRKAVLKDLESGGVAAMYETLTQVDPETAGRIAPGDTQRLVRATEVFRGTGKPLGHWLAAGNDGGLENVAFVPLVILPPRDDLYRRINSRFMDMIEEGAVEEVEHLLGLGLDPTVSAMKAVGVRELAGYLSGETSLETAIGKARQASRNYAKRQMTWFRNQIPEAEMVFTQHSESLKQSIFSFIRQFMLT